MHIYMYVLFYYQLYFSWGTAHYYFFFFWNRKFGRRVILIQLTKCNNVIIEPHLLL